MVDDLDDPPNPLRPPDEAADFFFFVLDLAMNNAVDVGGMRNEDGCKEHGVDADGETKALVLGHSASKKTTTMLLPGFIFLIIALCIATRNHHIYHDNITKWKEKDVSEGQLDGTGEMAFFIHTGTEDTRLVELHRNDSICVALAVKNNLLFTQTL